MQNKVPSSDVKKGMTLSQVTGIRKEAFAELLEQKRKALAKRENRSRLMIRKAIQSELSLAFTA